ncbi:MAG: cupin domain-containing protein [Propionibacteriaceae bacterium]|nr:cupin domain-containing protein [Propionibacteriaceae bacterium]
MVDLTDHGPHPYVLDIEDVTLANPNFRSTLWSGTHLQLTVMSIPVGGDIGLEVHTENDQFIRLEQGQARVEMGPSPDEVTFTAEVYADWVVFVPTGTWHNIINTGDVDLKVYTLYGPPHHPHGALHPTQADAEAAEHDEH